MTGAADPLTLPLLSLPGVPEAVAEARTAIETLHRHPANRRGWPRTAAAAAVRAARASAALDGAPLAVDPQAQVVDDPVLAGSLRVGSALGELAPVWQRSPLQALARLHLLAAADLADEGSLGRPSGRPGSAPRLGLLAQVATAAPWPGPVSVAVIHGELLAGPAAFEPATGVVARAAARLQLISSGLDPKGLSVPEVVHLRSGSAYRTAAAAYATGDPEAVSAWILQVCRALVGGAAEGTAIAEAAG